MTEKSDVDIEQKVHAAVSWLKHWDVESVVIGVDENGYYCMNSNVGYAMTAFMLREAWTKLEEAAEVQRQKNETE